MRLKRRTVRIGVLAVAIAAAGSGLAVASIVDNYTDDNGAFHGCVGRSGALRLVTPGTACRVSETAITWNQTGPAGPPGPPGETVRAFRKLRATPDEVEITAVGSGPIGLPTEGNPPTTVLTLELPKGVYEISASIAARKAWGNGDLLCWAVYELAGTQSLPIFTRASMGTDPGHAMRTTVSGGGFVNLSGGGGVVTLACWQASNDAAGSPSGERPHVFYAFLNATTVTRATLRRHGSDVVTEMP
jgi:hypothetical protein